MWLSQAINRHCFSSRHATYQRPVYIEFFSFKRKGKKGTRSPPPTWIISPVQSTRNRMSGACLSGDNKQAPWSKTKDKKEKFTPPPPPQKSNINLWEYKTHPRQCLWDTWYEKKNHEKTKATKGKDKSAVEKKRWVPSHGEKSGKRSNRFSKFNFEIKSPMERVGSAGDQGL